MSVVIEVDRLGKQYRLGQVTGRRLADDVNQWLARWRGKEDPLSKVGGNTQAATHGNGESFWALDDVSFQVKDGEVLGLIGNNGAGKSSILKVLSRVTAPTKGEVRVKGRIASLLEVGTGFHPELTGRENIFLNGAILGMTKAEIRSKFDEIVAFSGVEQFIDTPVKRYSSGMQVRLAFAVAAHLEPEILIVDEVLAVGDAAFQSKCIGKMKDVARTGRTILFVSHNADAVKALCQRVIWLKEGRIFREGTSRQIVDTYIESSYAPPLPPQSSEVHGLSIQHVTLRDESGRETREFRRGDDLLVEIAYEARHRIEEAHWAVGVSSGDERCFVAHMMFDGARPPVMEGVGTIVCRFKAVPLLPRRYSVMMGVRPKDANQVIIDYQRVADFQVTADLAACGFNGLYVERISGGAPMVVPYEWRLPDGRSVEVGFGQNQTSPKHRGNGAR